MIEAINGKGTSRAKIICDECGRDDTVTCDYERRPGGEWLPNEGQIIRKIEGSWSLVKGKLRCPACEAKRKAHHPKELDMTTIEKKPDDALRQPSPRQKREIIGMLELVYDDERKRFKDGESDKTVADAVGGGVLWGWVSAVREELFGPDTRNQEIEDFRTELRRLDGMIGTFKGDAAKAVTAMEAKAAELRSKLGALVE